MLLRESRRRAKWFAQNRSHIEQLREKSVTGISKHLAESSLKSQMNICVTACIAEQRAWRKKGKLLNMKAETINSPDHER